MAQLLDQVQIRLRGSSTSLGLILVKVLSGAIYGLTITLIFEEIFAYGHFAFWFVFTCLFVGFGGFGGILGASVFCHYRRT